MGTSSTNKQPHKNLFWEFTKCNETPPWSSSLTHAICCPITWSTLVQVMACHSFGVITWTNVDLLSNGPSGSNFTEISIKIIHIFSQKMHFKIVSAKLMVTILFRPQCVKLSIGWFDTNLLTIPKSQYHMSNSCRISILHNKAAEFHIALGDTWPIFAQMACLTGRGKGLR